MTRLKQGQLAIHPVSVFACPIQGHSEEGGLEPIPKVIDARQRSTQNGVVTHLKAPPHTINNLLPEVLTTAPIQCQ